MILTGFDRKIFKNSQNNYLTAEDRNKVYFLEEQALLAIEDLKSAYPRNTQALKLVYISVSGKEDLSQLDISFFFDNPEFQDNATVQLEILFELNKMNNAAFVFVKKRSSNFELTLVKSRKKAPDIDFYNQDWKTVSRETFKKYIGNLLIKPDKLGVWKKLVKHTRYRIDRLFGRRSDAW